MNYHKLIRELFERPQTKNITLCENFVTVENATALYILSFEWKPTKWEMTYRRGFRGFRFMLRWYYVGCVGISLVMLALGIWLHIFGYFILPPRCLIGEMSCPRKSQKELEKTATDMRRNVSFILSFIYWVQQPFHGWGSFSWIYWSGWIPQLRYQNTLNRFM